MQMQSRCLNISPQIIKIQSNSSNAMLIQRLLLLASIIIARWHVHCFQFSSFGMRRFLPHVTRLHKHPGLKMSSDHLRGTTAPITEDTLNIKEKDSTIKRKPYVTDVVDSSDSHPIGYAHIGKILGVHGIYGEVKMLINSDFNALKFATGSEFYIRKSTNQAPRPVYVTRIRKQGSVDSEIHLVLFAHVQTREVATLFNNYDVYVKERNARKHFKKDEYMVRDIVNLDCYYMRDYDAVLAQLAGESPATNVTTTRIAPLGRVVSIVPAKELYDGPAGLMHSQLELHLFAQEETKPLNRAARRKLMQSTVTESSANSQRVPSDEPMQCCLLPLVPSIVPVVDLKRRVLFLDPPPGLLDFTYTVHKKPGR